MAKVGKKTKSVKKKVAASVVKKSAKTKAIKPAKKTGGTQKVSAAAGLKCAICEKPMRVKKMPHGGFILGCSDYPRCKHTVGVKQPKKDAENGWRYNFILKNSPWMGYRRLLDLHGALQAAGLNDIDFPLNSACFTFSSPSHSGNTPARFSREENEYLKNFIPDSIQEKKNNAFWVLADSVCELITTLHENGFRYDGKMPHVSSMQAAIKADADAVARMSYPDIDSAEYGY